MKVVPSASPAPLVGRTTRRRLRRARRPATRRDRSSPPRGAPARAAGRRTPSRRRTTRASGAHAPPGRARRRQVGARSLRLGVHGEPTLERHPRPARAARGRARRVLRQRGVRRLLHGLPGEPGRRVGLGGARGSGVPRQAGPRFHRRRRQAGVRRNAAVRARRSGRARAPAPEGARQHRQDDHRGRRVLDGGRHRRRPRPAQDLAAARRRSGGRRRPRGRRARPQGRRHRRPLRPGGRGGPDRRHVLEVARVHRRLPGGTRGRDHLPALQRPAAGLHGRPAAVQHRRRAGRPARHAARAGAPRAPVAQCPPHPGPPPLAGLRHRHDGDTHHSVPHRRVREDADLLAQAVRRRRVHEPRGAAGTAAFALPPADQRDGHAHGRPDRLRARDLRQARKRVGGRLSAVRIAPVLNGRGLERFIAFPYDHHRSDPQWVPQLRMDVRTLLSPRKNPFFRHAEAQYFVAQSGGRTVGRIAAIKNDAHNREHHDRVGFYGFFESVNDQTLAHALFDTAAQWLRAQGCDTMRGPMSPSINDECGLLVHGFDTPPTLMMPHNPPYYVTLHDRYGFTKAKDLIAVESSSHHMPERLVRGAKLVAERRGITLRALDMKRFAEEVELVKALYNQAWEKNWGFVPLADAEIDHLAKQLKPVVVPDLVCFAERAGKVIGFAVALPDMNVALKHNPSGRLFPGVLKVLWHARRIHRLRVLLLGVLPEYRGTGVDALMYHWIWEKGNAKGYTWGEGGWILEDNPAMVNGARQLGFVPYKTYRIYDKPL